MPIHCTNLLFFIFMLLCHFTLSAYHFVPAPYCSDWTLGIPLCRKVCHHHDVLLILLFPSSSSIVMPFHCFKIWNVSVKCQICISGLQLFHIFSHADISALHVWKKCHNVSCIYIEAWCCVHFYGVSIVFVHE